MTGSQLLNDALALLATNTELAPDYAEYALPLINLLIAEVNGVNNTLRASKGKKELEEASRISHISEPLPTEEELNRAALVYGLCSKLLLNDDDLARVAYFQNMCVSEINSSSRWISHGVVDHYGGGE